MPKNPPSFEHYLLYQGIGFYLERLKYALAQQSFSELSEKTGIKASTLSQYNSEITHPSLPRLAAIAHECRVPLQWLLFGDAEPAERPQGLKEIKPKEGLKHYRVSDDVMFPTIAPMGGVLYNPLAASSANKIATEGIYLISLQGHKVVRRLQWQHNDECYLVFGDNPKYRPQSIKSPHIIGKAVSIVTPI